MGLLTSSLKTSLHISDISFIFLDAFVLHAPCLFCQSRLTFIPSMPPLSAERQHRKELSWPDHPFSGRGRCQPRLLPHAQRPRGVCRFPPFLRHPHPDGHAARSRCQISSDVSNTKRGVSERADSAAEGVQGRGPSRIYHAAAGGLQVSCLS
jgi:hypothetical protein